MTEFNPELALAVRDSSDWLNDLRDDEIGVIYRAVLEAAHHAELVETLQLVVRSADSRNRCAPYVTKAIRLLTKIGGAQ